VVNTAAGAFMGYPLSAHLYELAPHAAPIVFWTPIFGSAPFGIGIQLHDD
jgi:hypothetical protein